MPEGRRYEIQTASGTWRPLPFDEIRAGMVFRGAEPDGTPVVDGEGVARWRAITDAFDDSIEAEPVPESEAERAVREEGIFWPLDSMPSREGVGRGLR